MKIVIISSIIFVNLIITSE